MLIAAAAPTSEMTARLLRSKIGDTVPLATTDFYSRLGSWVWPLKPTLPDFTANGGLQNRDPILYEKTNVSISDPPPPPPPADISLSSTFDKQTGSSDGALKDIEPDHSDERKEKADEGYGDKSHREKIATGAVGIRDSSKRTAGRAGLNKGGECMHRLERARRID